MTPRRCGTSPPRRGAVGCRGSAWPDSAPVRPTPSTWTSSRSPLSRWPSTSAQGTWSSLTSTAGDTAAASSWGLASVGVRGRGRDIACLQVRLSPPVAHAVLGDCAELGAAVLSLDDLWGRDAARLQEQLCAAKSWDDRFATAETALVRRLQARRAVDPEVAFVWGQMVTRQGRVRVERLAAEVGWSRKRLWSRFSPDRSQPRTRRSTRPFRPGGPPSGRGAQCRSGGCGDRLRRPVPSPPGRHDLRRCDAHGRRGRTVASGRRRRMGGPRMPVHVLNRGVRPVSNPAGRARGHTPGGRAQGAVVPCNP